MNIAFTVDGKPVPEGDLKRGRHGKLYWSNDAVLRGWKDAVGYAARAAMAGRDPFSGPIYVRAIFSMPRPRSHYRTGRFSEQLRADAPRWMDTRPDLDKLDRAILDAMTDIVYTDDSRVALKRTVKVWAAHGRAAIEVFELSS